MLTDEFIQKVKLNLDENGIKLSNKDTKQMIKVLFKSIEDIVVNDDKISILGFGTFKSFTAKARECISPQTLKPMKISESKRVKFVPSKNLKSNLNK